MKGVTFFCRKAKFIPRYVGPYKVVARIGKVAYELELLVFHHVFQVSVLGSSELKKFPQLKHYGKVIMSMK
uniref:Putative ovule protein n=1 Tax=Solanum chacoense TaxID=4108 RepID=A0A0V0GXM8_SOLCH